MARFLWYLKQLTPRTYWSAYRPVNPDGTEGPESFCIWKMWLGRCYDVIHFPDMPTLPTAT